MIAVKVHDETVVVPRVSLVIELEADPEIVIHYATDADSAALGRWVRECRPDIHAMLNAIAVELQAKRAA